MNVAVQWADRIYHLAANVGQRKVLGNPLEALSKNIKGCEVILEAISETDSKARLLISSTSEVYIYSDKDSEGRVKEDAMIPFQSGKFRQESYPLSKLVNEVMLLACSNALGIESIIARVFNTIGNNQCATYGMVVPNFIEQALRGQPVTVFGNGNQSRSFCDVRDTVEALYLLMETQDAVGEIVNVGNDIECSIIDLAKLVIEITKSSSEIKYLTYKEAYGVDEFEDVQRRRPDLTKLKELTGFTHRFTLKETIEEILKSLRR